MEGDNNKNKEKKGSIISFLSNWLLLQQQQSATTMDRNFDTENNNKTNNSVKSNYSNV